MSRHTNILRAHKDAIALTEDQLRARVPSIFAAEAHGSRSDRYSYSFAAIRLDGGLPPPSCRSCSAHMNAGRAFAGLAPCPRPQGDQAVRAGTGTFNTSKEIVP